MTPKLLVGCARQISERDVAVLRWVGELSVSPQRELRLVELASQLVLVVATPMLGFG